MRKINLTQYMSAVLSVLTLFFNSKVNNGGLSGNLWCVVRVAQFGGDVETEVIVVLDLLVT